MLWKTAALHDRLNKMRALWRGRSAAPSVVAAFALARWMFLRALGATFVAAFASSGTQLSGLLGSAGILPTARFLEFVSSRFGPERFWLFPTAAWFGGGDVTMNLLALVGLLAGFALLLDVFVLPALGVATLAALSLTSVGQEFFAAPWDALLVEVGALALLYAPWTLTRGPQVETRRAVIGRWLLMLLIAKLLWSAGFAKLFSQDAAWHDLTALTYRHFTQPLPNAFSWDLYALPGQFQRVLAAAALAVEVLAPLALLWRRTRPFAGMVIMAYGLCWLFAGSAAFLPLLLMALCVPLLDDRFWRRYVPVAPIEVPGTFVAIKETDAPGASVGGASGTRRIAAVAVGGAFAVLATANLCIIALVVTGHVNGNGRPYATMLAPLRLANTYALFSPTTTNRLEVVVEGSANGTEWREYPFRHKPGDPWREPTSAAPHDPRLDRLMHELPTGEWRAHPWFFPFMLRLLQNEPEVVGLLARNPFPSGPPRYVRARLYEYRFATREERMADGAWWKRSLLGEYFPIASLETMPFVFQSSEGDQR